MSFYDNENMPRKQTVIGIMGDVAIISILWIVTGIFIITIGASTTAAYSVMYKRLANIRCSIFREFFSAFKNHLFKSTVIYVILMILILMNFFGIIFTETFDAVNIIFVIFQFVFLLFLIFIYIHIFPLIAKFNLDYARLIKTSIVLAYKHIPTSILLLITSVAVFYICVIVVPMLILLTFGIYCFISTYLLLRVYKKYEPKVEDSENKDESV
jgi:uncharacterized membrane protein YesL